MKSINRYGPRCEPCGIPENTVYCRIHEPPMTTLSFLFSRLDLNQLSKGSEIPSNIVFGL